MNQNKVYFFGGSFKILKLSLEVRNRKLAEDSRRWSDGGVPGVTVGRGGRILRMSRKPTLQLVHR